MTDSLYDRLGGSEGIRSIANDIVDNHCKNPVLAPRFEDSDIEKLKEGAATFFIAGTGGPQDAYKGKDMRATHKTMNSSNDEFVAVLDDAMLALKKNNIDQRTQEEVLFVLYSFKGDIVNI